MEQVIEKKLEKIYCIECENEFKNKVGSHKQS